MYLPEDKITAGELVPVTVIGLAKTGAIVQIDGTEYTSFIHISKIAKGYVKDVGDYVSKGDKLDAMGCTKGNRPELILTHLDLQPKESKQAFKQEVPTASQEYTSVQHIPKSLDAMIADADRSYKDKFGHRDKKVRPRRRSFKKNPQI